MAVKMLQLKATEPDRVRFLQEAAIMGQFHHPNVVKLHGVVTRDDPVSQSIAPTACLYDIPFSGKCTLSTDHDSIRVHDKW